MQLGRLFQHFAGLTVERAVLEAETVTFLVHRTTSTATCPSCHRPSRHVHSRYQRHLWDEPLGGRSVAITWRVRRFRCSNRRCSRRTFAEQAPLLVAPHARHSVPLRATWQHIGLALGGRAGERLCRTLRRPSSLMTLLRLVHALPLPTPETPRVLGVDDWALRRGRTYGTILVAHEQHAVLDLLPDRTDETLAAWLRAHPGVEIVTRDRAGAYAEGIRQGAPDAEQVADAFHVLVNLREALERVLSRQHTALQLAALATKRDDGPILAEPPLTSAERQQRERRARRVGRYEAVRQLQAQGVSLREISRQLHLARRTVRRFARAEQFPERQPRRPRHTLLTPYEPYLRQRWAEGCHTAKVLWREVRDRGFQGGYSALAGHLKRWREAVGATRTMLPPRPKPVSVRQASWWLLRHDDELTAEEQAVVRTLQAQCPEVRTARRLAHRFRAMVQHRLVKRLTRWLEDAERSGVPELRGFVRSLRLDIAAIRAMLGCRWSNGPTEGHINRLKMLKRQMFGRAGLPLLKRRLLLAP